MKRTKSVIMRKIESFFYNFIRNEKNVAAVLVILFMLQIIPILYLGQFNHPTSDDFLYGKASHDAWVSTGSPVQAVQAAIDGVKEDYYRWQGSYAALFFMRLEPTVFGEAYYAVVPYLMIGLLALGTLYFVRTLCKVVLKTESLHYISISMLILMLCIQFSPVASEQFFWYNSSVYYNAFHSFLLCYLAWILRYLFLGKKRYVVYMALFGIILGGGNYISALTLAILQGMAIVGAFLYGKYVKKADGRSSEEICDERLGESSSKISIDKQGKIYQRRAVVLTILWLEFLACFAVSALAPGNAVRAESTWGYGPVSSIIHSLIQGVKYYEAWTDKWWLLVALCLLPMMIQLIRKTSFSFAYPGIVIIFLYGVFSAMSCPTFYALGTTGPGRIINIIYDAFLMVTFIQLFYLTGWIYRKWEVVFEGKRSEEKTSVEKTSVGKMADASTTLRQQLGEALQKACAVMIGVLILVLVVSGSFLDVTTITACKVWIKGEAKQYDLEYKERLAQLEDETISDVVFFPYTVEPDLVFIADALDDPEFVNNREWADFYGKNSLIVRP